MFHLLVLLLYYRLGKDVKFISALQRKDGKLGQEGDSEGKIGIWD